ncbi:MAG: ankyrin repeat domain-containing protein [Gammaproteobacteria bacterium]|nr:ankyrin repeat domain-containing protein [Gammaproteobacteria bacterium]
MKELMSLIEKEDLNGLRNFAVTSNLSELNEGPPNYKTPLARAAENGKSIAVDFFVDECWSQLSQKDKDYAFLYYSAKGNLAKVKACLNNGASILAVDYGQNALHKSVSNKHVDVTQFLLERGVDPNQQDRYGTTPFMRALEIKEDKITDLFMQNPTTNLHLIDDVNGTALTYAIFSEQFGYAKKLIEKEGENFKVCNHPEALNWAIRKKRQDLVELMLKYSNKGINISGGKTTDVENASEEISHRYTALDLDECNDLALIWAVGLGHEEIVDLLLKHGANPETQNLNAISAKTISQDPSYGFPNIKAKLSAQGLKPLRSSREMQAIGIFKTEGPHSPEDTGRDKKESSPGREEKSVQVLFEELIKERAKQDAEFSARLEALKTSASGNSDTAESDKTSSGVAELIHKAAVLAKEATQQDEKLLEEFQALQSGQGKSFNN